jgi:hypothetical protein
MVSVKTASSPLSTVTLDGLSVIEMPGSQLVTVGSTVTLIALMPLRIAADT